MINIFKRKVNQAKHPLSPAEPTHRVWSLFDELMDLWVCNKTAIGLLIVSICISLLIFMIGYAAGTGHLHFLSTEQNNYEHLTEIVTFYGGRLICG